MMVVILTEKITAQNAALRRKNSKKRF